MTGGLAGALGGIAGGAALGEFLADQIRPDAAALCRYDVLSAQIDTSYNVMTPAASWPTRGFPTLGGTSIEAAFSFLTTVPNQNQPELRVAVPDVITFINAVLARLEQFVDNNERIFPAG